MSQVDLLAPPDAEAISAAVDAFAAAMKQRYGDSLKGLYLFGSRARGDFEPYSDVDVAVVLDDASRAQSQTKPLSAIAYDIFLETGAEIQPWVFGETEWADPARSPSPGLLRAVRHDSRAVPFS